MLIKWDSQIDTYDMFVYAVSFPAYEFTSSVDEDLTLSGMGFFSHSCGSNGLSFFDCLTGHSLADDFFQPASSYFRLK